MRRRRSPAKLAKTIHDGLGPIHTAISSKKRKAHSATDQLKDIAEEGQVQLIEVRLAFEEYDEHHGNAHELAEAIRNIVKGGK